MAPLLPNATATLARRAIDAVVARSSLTVDLAARDNSTATFARDNSTLSSLVGRTNATLVSRSNLTLGGLVQPVTPSGYPGASPVRMLARAATTHAPCAGCMDPKKVNNKVFFALFAILGAAMVVASIWFFFWAKNGGFHFQEGDWEDYKTTVLRRKGPDGKTIYSGSRGTRASVYHNKNDRIAAKSVVGYDEKGRKGIMSKRGFGGTHSVYYSDDFTEFTGSRADDMSEVTTDKNGRNGRIRGGAGGHHAQRYRDRDVHEYRHEKPARVGGLNRAADGTSYGYSDRSETMTETMTESSTAPLNPKDPKDPKRAKAEKRAHDEAARMERKWRKDAERAAAQIARESARESSPKKVSSPADMQAHRDRRASRSDSPKKQRQTSRAYSFTGGQDDASTVYTGTNTETTATTDRSGSSYYDAYRPLAQQSPRGQDRRSSSRHNSPTKHSRRHHADSHAGTSDSATRHERRSKPRGGRDVMAGYRRGMDSLASDSE